jgi:hypothetical protein
MRYIGFNVVPFNGFFLLNSLAVSSCAICIAFIAGVDFASSLLKTLSKNFSTFLLSFCFSALLVLIFYTPF